MTEKEITTILAVDPGSEQSAFVVWDGVHIKDKAIVSNQHMLRVLERPGLRPGTYLVIEQIRSLGMAVGANVFDTCWWSGRFYEAWNPGFRAMIPRMEIKMHICNSSRANDSNIRRALIDRFEPDLKPKQRPQGILKGVSKDIWSALALVITYHDKHLKGA